MLFIDYFRRHLVIVLSVTILCMSLGFIVLSFAFNSKKNGISSFDVSFTNIEKVSSVKGSDIEPIGNLDILSAGKKIDMNFSLNAVHDELTYFITIENKGTISAEIIDVFESPNINSNYFQNSISPISISISDVKGKIVSPGEKIMIKLVVYYPPSSNFGGKKEFNYSIGLLVKSH